MKSFYDIEIGGLKRALPICPITESLFIAGFVLLGDVDLTDACAKELLKIAPAHDIIITAEAKGIPLAHEMARLHGAGQYIVARKNHKLYMKNALSVSVHSITTSFQQTLYIDEGDVALLQNRRVLIVDDVISTGESLSAVETLVKKAGGNVVGKMAVLAEGQAAKRGDILFLQHLPLFNEVGEEIQ